MNKHTLILFAVAAMLAMPVAAQADLLVGFETWANNPNGGAGVINAATSNETGFSGDSTTVNAGWGRGSAGAHDDGIFGLTLAGASTTTGFRDGLTLNNGANGAYDFSITNGTADDYELEFFHFDSASWRPNSADEWTVSVQSGDLTTQTIETGFASNITGGVADWMDFDIDLSGLTGGNVLAAGQSVTFRLDMAGGTQTSHHQYVDNIAISGSVSAVPEPTSLAIFGLAGLGLAIRRRK